MQIETCPHCNKPVAVESGTGFYCCVSCSRRLLGFSWWPSGTHPASLPLFRTAGDAEKAAGKSGGPYEVLPVWCDVKEEGN